MRLKIMGKILLGFALILIMAVVVSALLIKTMDEIDQKYSSLIDNDTYAYAYTLSAVGYYNRAALSLKAYAINNDVSGLTAYLSAINEGDAQMEKIAPLLTSEQAQNMYNGFWTR